MADTCTNVYVRILPEMLAERQKKIKRQRILQKYSKSVAYRDFDSESIDR
jgi:hypothetical protein